MSVLNKVIRTDPKSPSRAVLQTCLTWGVTAGALATVVSFVMPKTFRAETRILPVAGGGIAGALPEVLGGSDLGSLLGGRLGGTENPILTYPEIIRSRRVLTRTLYQHFPSTDSNSTVMSAYRIKGRSQREKLDNGIKHLKKNILIRANPRSGIIDISADAHDPKLAAFVAATLIGELNYFNLEARSSRGRAVREFVHARLAESESALARAERALADFQRSNLRIGNSPTLLLDLERLQRDVSIQADIYRLLSRQYEMARIEEQRDTPTFSVLEEAVPPLQKFRPRVIVNALSASAFAILMVLVLAYRSRLLAVFGSRPSTG